MVIHRADDKVEVLTRSLAMQHRGLKSTFQDSRSRQGGAGVSRLEERERDGLNGSLGHFTIYRACSNLDIWLRELAYIFLTEKKYESGEIMTMVFSICKITIVDIGIC